MSNETKWTKGPWFVSTANNGNVYEMGVQSEHGMQWHVCDVCEGRDIDKEANAHLIATAPELYDSLEAMVERYAPAYHDCIDAGMPECEICEARAALAKARG